MHDACNAKFQFVSYVLQAPPPTPTESLFVLLVLGGAASIGGDIIRLLWQGEQSHDVLCVLRRRRAQL